MSSFSQVDTSTLGWVKAEIDETLKQARLALETFADDTSDDSRLRYCITHLHQVVGTLLMVELDGAAMLAKETEALADAVYNGSVEPTEAVFEALTRGILSIPDHLARLQGAADFHRARLEAAVAEGLPAGLSIVREDLAAELELLATAKRAEDPTAAPSYGVPGDEG